MRLLVSVRDAAEAAAAVQGGADVIDAKEPAAGALGAVAPATFAAILAAVPAQVPVSAALGDQHAPSAVAAAIAALPASRRAAPLYVKFAVLGDPAPLLAAAVEAAERHPARPRVIAAAYADAPDGAAAPIALLRAAAQTGVHGLLLDTAVKDGRTLLDFVAPATLGSWVHGVRGEGLLCTLAGSIGAAQLPAVGALGADLLGVRGAVCEGGRQGVVTAARVAALKAALG